MISESIKLGIWALSGIYFAVGIVLAGCGGDPVRPIVTKDYVAYFKDINTEWVFAYHTQSHIIDSFYFPVGHITFMTASADGRQLYLSTAGGIQSVSFPSLDISLFWAGATGATAVSRDGRYLAALGHGLNILRIEDRAIVYTDTMGYFSSGCFSADSHSFYACYRDSVRELLGIYRVSFGRDTTVLKRQLPFKHVTSVVPSEDETRLYLYLTSYPSAFAVYDVSRDSLAFQVSVNPGFGMCAVTPNGRYVFFTSPGTILQGPSSYDVAAFDVLQNQVVKRIRTVHFYGGDLDSARIGVGPVVITPDGSHLVGIDPGSGFFVEIEIDSLAVTRWEMLPSPHGRAPSCLTCQTNL